MTQPVFRFAPSPNGYLHLGHALSALINYQAAKQMNGRFLLRLEDIDTTRCKPDYYQAIVDDLSWLGLEWETSVRTQSKHFDDYRKALTTLSELTDIYPACASRKEIRDYIAKQEASGRQWPCDPDQAPLYPDFERNRSFEDRKTLQATMETLAWRLNMPDALRHTPEDLSWQELGPQGKITAHKAVPEVWGDILLARKDSPTTYHLSVVIDDALQGITHVVRGQDLYQSTSVHRLLQHLLGLPQPIYHHHRLILSPDGRKLSKSARDKSIRALRQEGINREDLLTMIAFDDQDLTAFQQD